MELLTLTAEAFNLFNWRNYSYYGSRMFDANGNPILNFGEGIGALLGTSDSNWC